MFSGDIPENFLKKSVQKYAQDLEIEGTAQHISSDQGVKIIACGLIETVEELLDVIHKEAAKIGIEDIQIEPFIKEKDYRRVFRIIE